MNETLFTPSNLLAHANSTVSTPLMRLMQKISSYDDNVIYCVVEGYDLPYYNPRVEAISEKKCEFIIANGKRNVLSLHGIIKKRLEYSKLKLLYFVDCDYELNDSIPNDIYITPGYSVENFYVSYKSFCKILLGIFHIDIFHPKFNLCKRLYEDRLNDFLFAVRDFCAWYKLIRMNGEIPPIELGESFPSQYAKIEISGIHKEDYSLADLSNEYPCVSKISLEQFEAELKNINLMTIRGKYVLQFIESLIIFLVQDSKKAKIYVDTKIEFETNKKTLLTRLSAFAETTDCLRKYVRDHS